MNIKDLICILAYIGGCLVTVLLVFILFGLFSIIKNFIQVQIHKYKIKHRFDKPPIAKCYCIDCKIAKMKNIAVDGVIDLTVVLQIIGFVGKLTLIFLVNI